MISKNTQKNPIPVDNSVSKTQRLLRIAVPGPFMFGLDYLTEKQTHKNMIGCRVQVSLGTRKVIGLVIQILDTNEKITQKHKFIETWIDNHPLLPKKLYDFIFWLSDYYQYPIGDCFHTALPKQLSIGKPYLGPRTKIPEKPKASDNSEKQKPAPESTSNPHLTLNPEQKIIIDRCSKKLNQFFVGLIDGITGSGKTEVYLQLIQKVLEAQKQILVLIPEISLTPQTLSRFEDRFKNLSITNPGAVCALHSALTDSKKSLAHYLAKIGQAKIIIGTRSALFTPFQNLGLIIIDEEHDQSLKQQSGLMYCARSAAIKRAHIENIPIILGSATPSLESLYNSKINKYDYFKLTHRAGAAQLPSYHLINMKGQPLKNNLSKPLLEAITHTLEQKQQVLLFINRRGFAPVLFCHHCRWQAQCEPCEKPYTLHANPNHLICHHCTRSRSIPKICENCGSEELVTVGLGTEKIELGLKALFPNKNILRIDRTNTRKKGELDLALSKAHSGEAEILIGTQMLAKGHHFKHVTLVGILDIDGALFSQDFRSLEHMGQLVTQVAGRAGREEKPGKVYIQTHQPDHPLLRLALKEGYGALADKLLPERQEANLPPYSHMALLRAEGKQKKDCFDLLQRIKTNLLNQKLPCETLGPLPALMAKKADKYRMQLLLQANSRSDLHFSLVKLQDILDKKKIRGMKLQLDIDPIGF